MKIHFDQLTQALQRGLFPIYWMAGDELPLIEEAYESIKIFIQSLGFQERIQFMVESNFDWGRFTQQVRTDSLFGDKQWIELRWVNHKFTDAVKSALMDYLKNPPKDKVLVWLTGKLEPAWQKQDWYKQVETIGLIIPIYPLQKHQMRNWIKQRLQRVDLKTDDQGIELLMAATEGNLLATSREIDKLSLLYENTQLSLNQIREAMTDSARYDVFHLTEAVLQSGSTQVIRIIRALKSEGSEPALVLWALLRELRQLIQIKNLIHQHQSVSQALAHSGVWEKKKPWMMQALQRNHLSELYDFLRHASRIDQIIKGVEKGDVWDELLELSLKMAVGLNIC